MRIDWTESRDRHNSQSIKELKYEFNGKEYMPLYSIYESGENETLAACDALHDPEKGLEITRDNNGGISRIGQYNVQAAIDGYIRHIIETNLPYSRKELSGYEESLDEGEVSSDNENLIYGLGFAGGAVYKMDMNAGNQIKIITVPGNSNSFHGLMTSKERIVVCESEYYTLTQGDSGVRSYLNFYDKNGNPVKRVDLKRDTLSDLNLKYEDMVGIAGNTKGPDGTVVISVRVGYGEEKNMHISYVDYKDFLIFFDKDGKLLRRQELRRDNGETNNGGLGIRSRNNGQTAIMGNGYDPFVLVDLRTGVVLKEIPSTGKDLKDLETLEDGTSAYAITYDRIKSGGYYLSGIDPAGGNISKKPLEENQRYVSMIPDAAGRGRGAFMTSWTLHDGDSVDSVHFVDKDMNKKCIFRIDAVISGIVLSPDGNKLYVSIENEPSVYILDVTNVTSVRGIASLNRARPVMGVRREKGGDKLFSRGEFLDKVKEKADEYIKDEIGKTARQVARAFESLFAFRFHKDISGKFSEILKERLGEYMYGEVKTLLDEHDLAWTDPEGELHWIDEIITGKYARDKAERVIEAIWESAREAVNKANKWDEAHPKYIRNSERVKEVIRYHEGIHELFRKDQKYTALVANLRTELEEKIGKLREGHRFIKAFSAVYGEPHRHEAGISDDPFNWYIEEFLALSIQENDLFSDRYAVLGRMLDAGTDGNLLREHQEAIKGILDNFFREGNNKLENPLGEAFLNTLRAEALYASARDLAPDIIDMSRKAPTYVMEPVLSEDDETYVTNYLNAANRDLGKKGHHIHARGYVAGSGWEENANAVITKLGSIDESGFLGQFYNDVTGFGGEKYGTNQTRLGIRLISDDYKNEQTAILGHIRSELVEQTKDEAAADFIIANKIRFVRAGLNSRGKNLNTVIDLVTDITMIECDRYGKQDGYLDEETPTELKVKFLRLLKLSVTNYDDIVKTSGGEDMKKILENIFSGAAILKIEPIDWASLRDWKRSNDELLRPL